VCSFILTSCKGYTVLSAFRNEVLKFPSHHIYWLGDRGTQWLRCCATNRRVAGSIPAGVIGFFIDIKSFRSHYGPGFDSASNRNEYQEYVLRVKAAVRKADNLPPSCAVVMKSGNPNFLESSGPVQACNGTDSPLPYLLGILPSSAVVPCETCIR